MKKRLRIFAGPNGSGKSSIIKQLLETKISSGRNLDFGIYVNADDLAKILEKGKVDFKEFGIEFNKEEFFKLVNSSGLISSVFPNERFLDCITIRGEKIYLNKGKLSLHNDHPVERIAQILAHYLREKLLKEGKKFSFETVLSHPGKIEFIKKAVDNGYKVYLYFVSTEDPEINVYRVKMVRVALKGHDVPEEKIRSRYYKAMDLLHEASQHCDQVYFFDNSLDGNTQNLFAHFKLDAKGEKEWVTPDVLKIPNWFLEYYSKKVQ